jgi:hypothetical protein
MVDLENITVLETEADVKQFLKEWKDEPKAKKVRRCGCGAELAKGRQKCDKCASASVRAGKLRYYRRRKGIDDNGQEKGL